MTPARDDTCSCVLTGEKRGRSEVLDFAANLKRNAVAELADALG